MTTHILDRARWAEKFTRHPLHPGAKLSVPVIDVENPLGEALDFAGLVETDGCILVHVPVEHGGPAEFTVSPPSR